MSDEAPVPSPSSDGRSRWGCLFLLIPIGFTAAILLAYTVLFGIGTLGSAASGDRVTIDLDTCPQAQELIQARIDHMGLASPEWQTTADGLQLTVTLPGTPADATVPETLARVGDFHLVAGAERDGESILGPEDVVSAELSLKELGNPLVVITLTNDGQKRLETWMEDHVEDDISVWLDAERIMHRPNDPPFRRTEIDIRAEGDDGQDNLRRAADWGILMTNGPLPCPTSVRSVSTVQAAG